MDYAALLKKYDVPVPRYTSYPTVPYWSDSPSSQQWFESLARTLALPQSSWSLYLHIPFCETLCTYCGCNTMIMRTHDREVPYVQTLLDEFEIYRQKLPMLAKKPLREMHLGGGTPTFLSIANLKHLVGEILSKVTVEKEVFEGSIEVDPRRTSVEQLQVLFDLGFTRVSMGVQDFDPEVQRLVNRTQPFEITRDLTLAARAIGYSSVNFDLIYGLPKQGLESFKRSIEQTIMLKPDRIALYSLARVPWIKPAQRLFKDSDLPEGADKRALFEAGYVRLKQAGYIDIGMDHFALPGDGLALALRDKSLHRNFMGYTNRRTDVLLGLGVSSISETPDCFHQNEKVLPLYEKKIAAGEVPTHRGHVLSEEDQRQREQILAFMCQGEVRLRDEAQIQDVRSFLADMIQDGLVVINRDVLALTEAGRPFLRNASVALDQRLRRQKPETRVFSQAL